MARFHHLDPIVHRRERPLPPWTESRWARRPAAARPRALRRLIAGAASRQLADGLLRDATGRRPLPHHVPRFVEEVVSRLPADGFVLGADYVQQWARVT